MRQRVKELVTFVEQLELPPRPRQTRGAPAPETMTDFAQSTQQALVVGSDIVSFVAGTAPALREGIINCSLLAQLAANRQIPARDDLRSWYRVYFDTLTRLGWVIQDHGFSEHRETGETFEVQKAILAIAASLFGPAASALAVIKSVLEAMKSMSDGRWFSIFSRESTMSNAARFQVTVAEPASEGGSMISLMTFEISAKSEIDQVLFFKFRTSDVTLRHASGRVTIDAQLLSAIGPAIRDKVSAYTRSYIENLSI